MRVRQVDLTPDRSTGIQNDERIGGRSDLDARRVTTVADRAWPRCRNGTTRPPEPQSQGHVRRASALGGNNGKRDNLVKGRLSPVTCDGGHILFTCGLGRAAPTLA